MINPKEDNFSGSCHLLRIENKYGKLIEKKENKNDPKER